MAANSRPVFVYINGYPGVGKLAVARALQSIMAESRVVDNHKLIDATSSIFEREMPEYQPLRSDMRRLVLKSIVSSESTKNITWIFTDRQSSSAIGVSAVQDYAAAARLRGGPFVSIILSCQLDENIRRLISPSRGVTDTKLIEVDILRRVRESEDIFKFGGESEMEIDITHRTPEEAASEIKDFIGI